jgi:hypothetical protein
MESLDRPNNVVVIPEYHSGAELVNVIPKAALKVVFL